MHELSIAMSLLDVIAEEMIRHQIDRARSVTIEVGEQSGVDAKQLETAFTAAIRQTEFSSLSLQIRQVAGTVLDVVEIEVDDAATDT